MGEVRIVGLGKTRGYPYPICKKEFSCIPDKDIRVSKNDVTLCKLDVNVKNRMAIAGSVDFFKLE